MGMAILALVALLPTSALAGAGASASQIGKAKMAHRRRPDPRRVAREPRSWWLRWSDDGVASLVCIILLLLFAIMVLASVFVLKMF
jgi:hypothetical protein